MKNRWFWVVAEAEFDRIKRKGGRTLWFDWVAIFHFVRLAAEILPVQCCWYHPCQYLLDVSFMRTFFLARLWLVGCSRFKGRCCKQNNKIYRKLKIAKSACKRSQRKPQKKAQGKLQLLCSASSYKTHYDLYFMLMFKENVPTQSFVWSS